MTANEVFALAAGWLVQTPEESDDVKPFVPGMLNVLLAEALPYENALRRQEGLEELKEAPKVTAASMEEEIDYRPVLLRIALTYGLAADFCRAAENNAMMDDFRAKYVTALWESQQAKSETIQDLY